jgi:hypothetical protein
MTMWQATSGNQIYPSQTGLEEDIARLVTTGDSAHPHQDEACKVLKQYFDDLEMSLFDIDKKDSISRLQSIWIEISHFIQTEKNHIFDDGYNRLLNRLTAIYTRGVEQDRNLAFAATATNYADLIEIVSQAHPTYDYSEAIGHLLHFMNQLYKDREKSWLTIFDHLLSMPEYIKPIYYLKQRHLKEIQQWVEEGVDNLFQIRDDQALLHSEKIAELAEMEQAIELMSTRLENARLSKVIPITLYNDQASCQRLRIERDNLISDLENRQELIELLENNIQEFEDKIFATRRACAIRPIQN